MLQLRVIGPADQIDQLSRALEQVPGVVCVPTSGVLPARTSGDKRRYLTLLLARPDQIHPEERS